MSLESPNLLNDMSESSDSTEFPARGWWKIFYAVFLIVVPAFSFWAVERIKPEWQSGDREAYVALLMLPEAAVFFLILIVYSILCYLLLLFHANRFAKSFISCSEWGKNSCKGGSRSRIVTGNPSIIRNSS